MKKEDLKITTYQDDKGYVFISYSSADEAAVFEKYIVPLQEQYGLRVFCDKNFKNHANQTWTQQMKENICASSCCLIFVSPMYAASYACLLEVLYATYYKIPVLKIQLESPGVTKEFTGGKMSDSTRDAFKTVGKMLGNSDFKEAENCYLELKEHIESGHICKYDVSRVFCNYLDKIACTKLNQMDGPEAIVKSLESIQNMDRSLKCVFEKQSISNENVPAQQELYGELRIGKLVQKVLKPLLISRATEEELCKMQEAEYSKKIFGIQYPLLLKTQKPEAERHYYKDLFQINGESYRLCCEWYETEANNDRPFVEKWIKEHE